MTKISEVKSCSLKRFNKKQTFSWTDQEKCWVLSQIFHFHQEALQFLFSFCHKWSEVKVSQSCLTLWDPHGLYSPCSSPGQNTGVGSLSLLQRIFPTQRSNPGLLYCRQITVIVNSTAMNSMVHMFLWIMFFSGYMPRSRIAGSYGSSIFSF